MIEPTDKFWGISKPFIVFMLFLTIITVALIVCSYVYFADQPDTKPPFGCAWVDLEPTNASNYHLACVEGYGTNR